VSSVLDASAVLAILRHEPGGDVALAAIEDGCFISAVNLCEVVGKLQDSGLTNEEIEATFPDLELEALTFTEQDAMAAGLLRIATRHFGLSLADRACIALAQRLGLPAMTADRTWGALELDGLLIQVIR
jgi:PIN domain nuclease of toxin-antitoxin system